MDIIEIELMASLLDILINKQYEYFNNKNNRKIIDEISENIFILNLELLAWHGS